MSTTLPDAAKQQATAAPPGTPVIHPVWLRITHWLNVLAVLVMVTSGWRIYNASRIWNFTFPNEVTLGGWLGGALQWHFAGMWLLGVNGLLYLATNIVSGRAAAKFFPLSPKAVWHDATAALRGKLSHADPRRYNAVQRAAYLFVIVDLLVIVLSGLVLWKSVQFPVLRDLTGGYEGARRVHFVAMSLLVAFVAGHIVMALFVPRTIVSMIRGR